MTRALAFAVVLVGLLSAASAAHAVPVLDPLDAEELAQSLATATDEQDVCYGWVVELQDDSGGQSGTDVGSNRGPGVAYDQGCERYVVLVGRIHYTSETSESEDSADVAIESNLPDAPTEGDLDALGLDDGKLTKDDNDVWLVNMVEALPLLTAEHGAAPAIPFETAELGGAARRDVPTGKPRSDFVREYWPVLAVGMVIALAGLAWLAAALLGFLSPEAAAARRRRRATAGKDD